MTGPGTPDTPPSPNAAQTANERLAARRARGAVPLAAHDDHRGLPQQHNGTLGTDPANNAPRVRPRTALGRRAALRRQLAQTQRVPAFQPDTGQAQS